MRTAVIFVLLAGLASAQASDPEHLFQQAMSAQQRGDYPAAIRVYAALVKSHPDSVAARVNLGISLAHLNRFNEAISEYRAALKLDPGNKDTELDLGLAYYKKGDFGDAAGQLSALHRSGPENARVATLLADCDVHLGRNEAALAILNPLEPVNTANLDFQYVLGTALIHAGRLQDGASRVETVADQGNSADAYLLAGSTRLKLNDYAKARRDLEAAIRLNPTLPGAYTLLGMTTEKIGDLDAAEGALRKALQFNRDDYQANLYLGAIFYGKRNLDEARRYLEHALLLNPSSQVAQYELALVKNASGQTESAVTDLEHLERKYPDWLPAHVELAALYYRLRRPDDGLKERQIVERLTAKQQARGPVNFQEP